jgi:hypothetical protein
MKEDAYRYAWVPAAIYDGRRELGYSIESEFTEGAFDVFVSGKFVGTYSTRAAARLAIITAAE